MQSLFEIIRNVTSIDSDAPAIEYRRVWFTWGDFATRMSGLIRLYEGLGLGPDARVAVILRNRIGPFVALFSVIASERCLVTLNPLFPDATLAASLRELRPPVVVATASDWTRVGLTSVVREIGAAGIELDDETGQSRLVTGLDLVTGASLAVAQPGVIIEMLTSGTTGTPKRVPLQRAAFAYSLEQAMAYEGSRSASQEPRLRLGIQILHAPIAHIGGLWHAINNIVAGRKVCLLERFQVDSWHDAIVRHRPKASTAVPAALRMILDADLPAEDLSSLAAIVTGTAPCEPELVRAFWDRYQIPVLVTYGATEFSGAVAGWTVHNFHKWYEQKVGSVGRLQKGVEARIVDPETGAIFVNGEEGVLELRSPQLGDPSTWLRTTDRAVLDAEGFLWIKGRADSAILRGGFKIHPDHVAAALQAHPLIREAAVVGISDSRLGEVPAAAYILKSGAEPLSDDSLRSFLKDRLLPYQIPNYFVAVDDLPRTVSLKPALPAIRELISKMVHRN